MKHYRIDQIKDGKVYEGGKLYRLRNEAERIAIAHRNADEATGEYKTSYMVTPVEV